MLEETGTVVEANEDSVVVETQSRSACSQCSSGICGTSAIAKLFEFKANRVTLPNSLGARIGQQVVVGIQDALLVRASLLAYLLPLLIMFALVLFAKSAGASDGQLAVLAPAGLLLGLWMVRRLSARRSTNDEYHPTLLRFAFGQTPSIDITNLVRKQS
ncbi:MAG: SoxR reducing system RseC family protein [Candidatus Sedimenticola endophacoides]